MTVKPDDLRRCLLVYESEIERAARFLAQQITDIETTYRRNTDSANQSHNASVRQARESLLTNLKDAGLD